MVSNTQDRFVVAGLTFVVWAVVAASAVYWGFKLTRSAETAAAPTLVRAPVVNDPMAVARLLGSNPVQAAAAPAVNLASRFSLQGVVASGRNGAALIAVDGKPPKPFRIGASVDEGLVLKTVEPRKAVLAASVQAPDGVTLELPLKR